MSDTTEISNQNSSSSSEPKSHPVSTFVDASKSNVEAVKSLANLESSARSYAIRFPVSFVKGEGSYLFDSNGKKYLDMLCNAGTLALGHNHPVALKSLQEFISSGSPWQLLDFSTDYKHLFVQQLWKLLPPDFAQSARIQFCGPSGADAVEAAIKLVKSATGRRSIISFSGGYHGMTCGALSLTGEKAPKETVANLMADVHFVPFPLSYRNSFGVPDPEGVIAANYFEFVLKHPQSGVTKPAGVIIEAVQGEGGVNVAPLSFLKRIRKITQDLDIPLIIDEIQAGIGRTGSFFAFEQYGITPDVVTVSKAVGGGMPMSIVLYNKKLDTWKSGAHAGTFRGNQIAFKVGADTLSFMKSNNLFLRVQELGKLCAKNCALLESKYSNIGQSRGRGLMWGLEIVDISGEPDSQGTYPPNGPLAVDIQRQCFLRGLILERGGHSGCVVRLLPPLTMSEAELDLGFQLLDEAIAAALDCNPKSNTQD